MEQGKRKTTNINQWNRVKERVATYKPMEHGKWKEKQHKNQWNRVKERVATYKPTEQGKGKGSNI